MGWAKFWFRDYEADVQVRMCSYAAQGVWMRMLCWMHEGTPYGHFTLQGRPVPEDQLAKLLCGPLEEIKNAMVELENQGVFDRTEDGIIYSRRMVRQGARSATYTQNGLRGGNPRLKNKSPQQDAPTAPEPDKGNPNRITNPEPKNAPSRSSRKEEPDATHQGAPKAPPAPKSTKDLVWQDGLAIVQDLTRATEKACRTFLGKMLKEARNDHELVWRALEQAAIEKPGDPGPWLMAAARRPATPPPLSGKAAWLAKNAAGLDGAKKTHNDVAGAVIDAVAEEVEIHVQTAGSDWDTR